jgi:hypothetical protein
MTPTQPQSEILKQVSLMIAWPCEHSRLTQGQGVSNKQWHADGYLTKDYTQEGIEVMPRA